MTYEVVYNTTAVPLVSDDEGRTIGGREWGVVDTTSDATKQYLETGDFTKVDVSDASNASAQAAKDRADDMSRRSSRLSNFDKDTLVELARGAGVDVDPDDPPHKSELVHMLAARSVDPPSPPKKQQKTTTTESKE